MQWNWQKADWPHFTYDKAALDAFEAQFLLNSGEFIGVFKHFNEADRNMLRIELISDEAIKTSAIEGEVLDRASVQSSLRRHFGLDTDENQPKTTVSQQEKAVAEMMSDLYASFASSLTHEMLYAWHRQLMVGSDKIRIVGAYRSHDEPMQIVSGSMSNPRVHFEAPPSYQVPAEMDRFVSWYNETAPHGSNPLPPLTRAGIAHLYYECIHPFEDGNGRIGRALSEKALAQTLGQPSLIALSYTIERGRRRYYEMLEHANKDNEITEWLTYFAQMLLEAQQSTLTRAEFYIQKTRYFDKLRNRINARQEKVLTRMFREGPNGFTGGMSAEKYIAITRTSTATATRDLSDLVEKGALSRTGERRHTRYWLNLQE